MAAEAPVTLVEVALRRRRRLFLPLYLLLALIFVLGVIALVLGIKGLWRLGDNGTPHYTQDREHFFYGSIGAEPESGLPYWVWQALPRLFPEAFKGRADYSAFGFLYENGPDGRQRDLPIGVARREVKGVELVWLNCATCHTGTVQETEGGPRRIIAGMPSNNLDLYDFIRFLLNAGADERLSPDKLIPAMKASGARFSWLDEKLWRYYVIPRVQDGLIQRRSHFLPLLDTQPAWGPGRVDTFDGYKLIQMGLFLPDLAPAERIGTADFPAVFEQGPRRGMRLHWDGNNDSLAERNLSAAIGAGVTPASVDHPAIERVADWLMTLKPPASPYRPDAASATRGKAVYMQACAACHGYQDGDPYVFKGEYLGEVDPNAKLGVDPARLDSYTQRLRDYQVSELFKGTPYQFSHFQKTDGYANLPLDGLWLRAPYLHDGAVPTLADLLKPPGLRPVAFVRGIDTLDLEHGGFVAPACNPDGAPPGAGLCFDTGKPGNGNGGHLYGTDLAPAAKADLLAYLLTF
jgi:mono/diheme cytochrome c family protein